MSTIIKYKNSQNNFITYQQVLMLDDYEKVYMENDVIIKEETFYKEELMGVSIFNNTESHQVLINNNQFSGYKWINIVEITNYTNEYKLYKRYGYNLNGVLNGINLELEDTNKNIIAFGYKNVSGNYEYNRTRKYYFDNSINPNGELFECTYKDNGELWGLYWNNEHINNSGQDSIVLWDTPEDLQQLIDLTGMSQELAEYYMSSEIEPKFETLNQ